MIWWWLVRGIAAKTRLQGWIIRVTGTRAWFRRWLRRWYLAFSFLWFKTKHRLWWRCRLWSKCFTWFYFCMGFIPRCLCWISRTLRCSFCLYVTCLWRISKTRCAAIMLWVEWNVQLQVLRCSTRARITTIHCILLAVLCFAITYNWQRSGVVSSLGKPGCGSKSEIARHPKGCRSSYSTKNYSGALTKASREW